MRLPKPLSDRFARGALTMKPTTDAERAALRLLLELPHRTVEGKARTGSQGTKRHIDAKSRHRALEMHARGERRVDIADATGLSLKTLSILFGPVTGRRAHRRKKP